MLKRMLAVSALGLALGLAACDQSGQEQAQNPNGKSQDHATPAPQQQGTEQTPPQDQPQNAPTANPPASSPPSQSGQ